MIQKKMVIIMKKFATWMAVISIVVFIVAWGIVGLKILDNSYDFITEAYVALISMAAYFICILYVKIKRCPYCGRMQQTFCKYCPYCGKEIK